MCNTSFKEMVAQKANEFAVNYRDTYINYEYLLCSDVFSVQNYYIISAKEDNFRHLLGIHTELSPVNFYHRCLDGELVDADFDFQKHGESEKAVKGTVRRKIKAFPSFLSMMSRDLIVQEKIEKNNVFCTIATTDCASTVGFIGANYLRPKTLLKGDQIDRGVAGRVDLILRRNSGEELFNEVIIASNNSLEKYFPKIKDIISNDIYPT